MGILSKEALLGASDLIEREIELPSIGGSVRIRSLPAAYSNQAQSEALEMVTNRRGEQTAHVNTGKLEALQVWHALIDPKLDNLDEVTVFQRNVGVAWRKIVDQIDEISGIDKASIEETNARFQAGGNGTGTVAAGEAVAGLPEASGDRRSDLPGPASAGTGTDDR